MKYTNFPSNSTSFLVKSQVEFKIVWPEAFPNYAAVLVKIATLVNEMGF